MDGLKQWLTAYGLDQLYGVSLSDIPNYLFSMFLVAIWGWLLRRLFLNGTSQEKEDKQLGRQLILLPIIVLICVIIIRASLPLAIAFAGLMALIRFKVYARNAREMTYVILSIMMGLAFGAGQGLIACMAMVIIVPVLWLFNRKAKA